MGTHLTFLNLPASNVSCHFFHLFSSLSDWLSQIQKLAILEMFQCKNGSIQELPEFLLQTAKKEHLNYLSVIRTLKTYNFPATINFSVEFQSFWHSARRSLETLKKQQTCQYVLGILTIWLTVLKTQKWTAKLGAIWAVSPSLFWKVKKYF